MEYYAAIKMSELLIYNMENLKIIMLNKRRHTKKEYIMYNSTFIKV